MKDLNFVGPALPLRGTNVKGSFSPQLRPNAISASANQNTGMNTQTSTNAKARRKGKKTKTNTANPMDYVSPFLMGNGDDSSSSSDSFTSEDRRSSFPIDTGRGESVKFNYSVKSVVDTITDDFLYDTGNQKSVKQHISLSSFLPDTDDYSALNSLSLVKDQFSNTYDRWTTKIQEVRMNTSMYSFWTIDLVYKYIWNVIQALSVYCCLDSILAIEEPAGEVNRVNTVMKTYFNDPDLLVAQDALRRKLNNQWLPVNIRQLILWTYQLYKTNDTATSIQYRFVPWSTFVRTDNTHDAAAGLVTVINDLIATLDEQDMTRVRSILRSTLPSGCINRVPTACNRPTYDNMHHEIFANQTTIWSRADGAEQMFPVIPDNGSGYIAYGMKSDPTGDNGFAFSLSQSFKLNGYKDNDIFNTFRHGRYTNDYLYGTNNFYADPSNFNTGNVIWNRNTVSGTSNFDEVGLIHLVEIDSASGTASSFATVMPLGYQRVYFDTYGQRSLVSKQVFRELFSST